MNQHSSNPDTRIDQVLNALRTTAPPAGLESRIATRLSQAAESQAAEARQASATQARILTKSRLAVILSGARTGVPSGRSLPAGVDSAQSKDPRILLAPARLYPIAAALALLLTITILHRRTPPTTAHATVAHSTSTAVTLASSPYLEAPGPQPLRKSDLALKGRDFSPAANRQIKTALAAEGTPPTTAQSKSIPNQLDASTQASSLGSHSPTQEAPDPDTIALAETLAPSHPAPPLPLTPQERLLQSATQPGAPIELAELDLAREPVLRAVAQARERAGLQQFIRSLISQLVTSESLDPTPQDNPQTAPDPTSSSTNEPPTNGASPQ